MPNKALGVTLFAVVVIATLFAIFWTPTPVAGLSPEAFEKLVVALHTPTAPATEAPNAPATNLPIPATAAPSADAKVEGIWNAIEAKDATVRRRDLLVHGCILRIECRRASCIVFRRFPASDNSNPFYLPPGTCQARDIATSMADVIRGTGKDEEVVE